MTPPFLTDFAERKKQVRHYLAVVSRAERAADLDKSAPTSGRLLVLRAGTFLVLYNLVESSIRGAIEAIHDKIVTESVKFESLSKPLRREAVRLFKRQADPAASGTWSDFAAAFVAVALTNSIEFSGNVDARLIRTLASLYGFSCDTTKNRTRDGSDLLTVKTNRNDLAHGLKTFEEVGRSFPSSELLLLSRRTFRFLNEILLNIGEYIRNSHYLEPPSA